MWKLKIQFKIAMTLISKQYSLNSVIIYFIPYNFEHDEINQKIFTKVTSQPSKIISNQNNRK